MIVLWSKTVDLLTYCSTRYSSFDRRTGKSSRHERRRSNGYSGLSCDGLLRRRDPTQIEHLRGLIFAVRERAISGHPSLVLRLDPRQGHSKSAM